MPAALVASLAGETGISVPEAERRWKKAKAITADETGMEENDGEDFWTYTVGVFKKSMGIGAVHEAATAAEIHAAAHEAATSHLNDLPQPTEAQKEAGVFKKGHVRLHGLGVTIEIPKGSQRTGIDRNGKPWGVTMAAHYGYLKRHIGADEENFDCYIGDNPESDKVWIVDQLHADTGAFDESKALLCFPDADTARETYIKGFSDGRGGDRLGAMTEITVDAFKKWLKAGDTAKPVSGTVLESATDYRSALEAATTFEDIKAVFAWVFPGMAKLTLPAEKTITVDPDRIKRSIQSELFSGPNWYSKGTWKMQDAVYSGQPFTIYPVEESDYGAKLQIEIAGKRLDLTKGKVRAKDISLLFGKQ